MLNQYQPLFLKYRPQAINELVGQNQVTVTLTNAIKYSRISHAYLFTGPRGTGKTSTARIFAKSLNCEHGPTASPCQNCTSCLEIKQGISPAVFEIDAASNNSVDDARLLIERAPLSACGGRFKLYIIDECHMLTKEAFNALLKTIEEPPANVIFILATTEEHKVPATIVSRCQKLIFRLIDEQAMGLHLNKVAQQENITVEPEAITAIARRANGGLRDALNLFDQVSLLGADGQTVSTEDVLLLAGALPEDILIAMSRHILSKQGKETLLLVQELLIQGREANLIAAELAKHMLNIAKARHMSEAAGGSAQLTTYQKALLELSLLVNDHELVQMIEELDRLEIACRRSTQPVMNLEIGLLSLCHRLDIIELSSIQSRLAKLENGQQHEAVPQPAAQKAEQTGLEKKIKPIKDTKLSNDSSEPELVEKALPKTQQPIPDKIENQPSETSSTDIDILWQNILAELQRRHLPTFSLVSTHAFPVSLTEGTLTIGVLVENFQKMLENKIEYIKTAATACNLKPDLNIRVKLTANGENTRSTVQKAENLDTDAGFAALHLTRSTNKEESSGGKKANAAPLDKHDQTAVKEAYRLFEGPGSRFIAPN